MIEYTGVLTTSRQQTLQYIGMCITSISKPGEHLLNVHEGNPECNWHT